MNEKHRIIKNKYYQRYVSIIMSARAKPRSKKTGVYEIHHIFPKSMYPEYKRTKKNLVLLTPKEHFVCHHLLTKIVIFEIDKKRMDLAFWKMVHSPQHSQRITSKIYQSLRSSISKIAKQRILSPANTCTFLGKKHSDESKKKMLASAAKGNKVKYKKSINDMKDRLIENNFEFISINDGTVYIKCNMCNTVFTKSRQYLMPSKFNKKMCKCCNPRKPMTDEHKQKISNSQIGKKISSHTRQLLCRCNTGKKHSDESKKKMSESRKGTKLGKLNSMFGKKHSDESKKKMSESRKGANHSKVQGTYCTPFGNSLTPSDIVNSNDLLTNETTIRRWCKNNSKIISKISYNQSSYLQSIGPESIGKSFKDLGFEYKLFEINEIGDFITSNGAIFEQYDNKLYIPESKLHIHFHKLADITSNQKSKDNDYHTLLLDQTKSCELNGDSICHILDIEWNDDTIRSIWKSTILHKLNKTRKRYYARKCIVVPVSNKQAKTFLEANHLQGAAQGGQCIGLAFNGELLSVAVFAKSRYRKKSNNTFEILRFASKINTSVIGGFTKILKKFKNQLPDGSLIISYANRRWSKGNVYEVSKFSKAYDTDPCYYYYDGNQLYHRSIFQKHKLKDRLEIFDPQMTEVENMYNNGWSRYWDVGTITYEIS